MAFIDLRRAYDSVDRNKLWQVMANGLHIPPDLVKLIRNMYIDSKGIIKGSNIHEYYEFLANMGVK